jgi:hypothetical protein
MTASRNRPFYSAKRRLARAKQHIRRFEKSRKAWHAKRPYKRITDLDIDTLMHKVKITKPFYVAMIDASSEALEALRSVLDQAGYAAAVASGKAKPKRAHFPFGDDAAGLGNTIGRGSTRDLPDEILALFCGFKPYKGGNNILWALNKLANTNKHALLAPTSFISGGFSVHSGSGPVTILHPAQWDRMKNEITFAHSPAGVEFNYHIQLAVAVAFDEIETARDMPAIDFLNAAAGIVESILLATEGECRRIGLQVD